jgi:hypothetical protein
MAVAVAVVAVTHQNQISPPKNARLNFWRFHYHVGGNHEQDS